MGHSFGTTESQNGLTGSTNGPNTAGVVGRYRDPRATHWEVIIEPTPRSGVVGFHLGHHSDPDGAGVHGESYTGDGVHGVSFSSTHVAVFGENRYEQDEDLDGPGGSGVLGVTKAPAAAGVFGANNGARGVGVQGNGPTVGVRGFSADGVGLLGISRTGPGALAQSEKGTGLIATCATGQAISAFSDNDIAIFARGASFAGVFEGAVVINKGPDPKLPASLVPPSAINGSLVINDGNLFVNKGDVILANADCAEDFDLASTTEAAAGTVMVLDQGGVLRPCATAYDRKVAGVVSGAGTWRPAIVLDRRPGLNGPTTGRVPLALVGKVYCKVDARHDPIAVGDLLTTSPTSGHAMRAADPWRAFGAVIGKALDKLENGLGLIPILVALH